MENTQFRKGRHFPSLHPGHLQRDRVLATTFQGDVPPNALVALPSKELNRSGYASFVVPNPWRIVAALIFKNGSPGNAKPWISPELLQQPLVITGFK